jgi:hypothetical protein
MQIQSASGQLKVVFQGATSYRLSCRPSYTSPAALLPRFFKSHNIPEIMQTYVVIWVQPSSIVQSELS